MTFCEAFDNIGNTKMQEIEQKVENYELGFHLIPELEDEQVRVKAQEIEANITQLGGTILGSHEPRKQRLSYPIEHKRLAYFGVINFKSPTEALEDLENTLKLNDSLLRFLVLKVRENPKVLRSLKESSPRTRIKTHTPPSPQSKPKEEIKPEVMEKQIEDVIGNI